MKEFNETIIAIEKVCIRRHWHIIQKGKIEREASDIVVKYLEHLIERYSLHSRLPFGFVDWFFIDKIENLKGAFQKKI